MKDQSNKRGIAPAKNEDGRRGSGSNKTRRKQREYKAHVHAQLTAGKKNQPGGNWT